LFSLSGHKKNGTLFEPKKAGFPKGASDEWPFFCFRQPGTVSGAGFTLRLLRISESTLLLQSRFDRPGKLQWKPLCGNWYYHDGCYLDGLASRVSILITSSRKKGALNSVSRPARMNRLVDTGRNVM